MNNYYTGGDNDGYSVDKEYEINPLINIYYGGQDDGFDAYTKLTLKPNCFDSIVYWKGAISTDWFNNANWDCNILPKSDSRVILKSNLPYYPLVNGNDKIFSLFLKPTSSIKILPTFTFKLLGND